MSAKYTCALLSGACYNCTSTVRITGPPRISASPGFKGTSEALACVLAKLGIQMAHKPVSTVGHFLPRPKYWPPREKAQGVIYKAPWVEYPATYIGEMKNYLESIRRHKNGRAKIQLWIQHGIFVTKMTIELTLPIHLSWMLELIPATGCFWNPGTLKPCQETSIGLSERYHLYMSTSSDMQQNNDHGRKRVHLNHHKRKWSIAPFH